MFGFGSKAARPVAPGRIQLSRPEIRAKIEFRGLTVEDLGRVAAYAVAVAPALESLADAFYAKVGGNPATAAILAKRGASASDLRPRLVAYVKTLFAGVVDDAWVAQREKVGGIHDAVELDAAWYLGMYDVLRRSVFEAVRAAEKSEADRRAFEAAFQTLLDFDTALTLDALMTSRAGRLQSALHDSEANRISAGFVTELAEVAHRISERDLSARLASADDEFAVVRRDLNGALESLEQAIELVGASCDRLTSASSEINLGAQSVASATTEQAGSLQEVTQRVGQVSEAGRAGAAKGVEARRLAGEVKARAEEGAGRMQALSAAIEKIKGSADETAKIVKTIDEIAFQTNLLALNAAVEAARAGDAGKGFAVVGEEVRALAMRSAQAARSTSELIAASVRNAEAGVDLNSEASVGFKDIVAKIAGISEVMSDIATNAETQRDGLTRVDAVVVDINKAVQQNAAASEEAASAASELASLAGELKRVVRSFRTREDARPAGAPTKAKAPPPRAPSRPVAAAKLRPPAKPAGKQAPEFTRPLAAGAVGPTPKSPATLAAARATPMKNVAPLGKNAISPEALIPFDDDEGAKNLNLF
jgi:methyl-accepting chemotaxis protein